MKELAPRCFDDLERAVLPRISLDLRQPCGAGQTIRLELEQDAFNGGISGVVYDASIRLAQYLADGGLERELSLTEIQHGAVLELGCGVGLVGMATASLGSKVVLTDRSQASIELAKKNIVLNGLSNYADAVRWSWEADAEALIDSYGPFQLIVASDVVYREELVQPLLSALHQLLVKGNHCLMAYSLRNTAAEKKFAAAALENGIKLCRVDDWEHAQHQALPGVTLRKQVHLVRLSV